MIGIVGAGITGLALAHELAKRRVDCIILEGAPEPGGVIQTKEVEGHLLETGPQRIRLTGHVRALVAELGLEGEVIQAPPGLPLYIYRNGQLRPVPLSLRELFRTPALSWRGRARVLLEPLTERELTDRLSELAQDPAGLRRAMVDQGLVQRTRDGAEYWRTERTEYDHP